MEPRSPVVPRLLALVALLLLSTSCAASGPASGSDPFAGAEERRIVIRVENLAADEMSVSVLGPQQRRLLGVVAGRSSATFTLPWRDRDFLRFQIEPVGGSPHTTPSVSVGAGERVELFLRFPASRSSVTTH